MTDDLKAPERIWAFDRYVNGVLMAEGVTITLASSFEEACVKAAKLASRGPNNEAPVLVLGHRDSDRIATLETALADMTRQRDAAMAGAVKVKPLDWHEGDEPDEWKSGPYDVWCEFGKFQLYHWATIMGDPQKTTDAAKAAAQADYEARILSALTPDPDRLQALTAAAYEAASIKCYPWSILCAEEILTLTPADAVAAIDRIIRQARADAMMDVADWYDAEGWRLDEKDVSAAIRVLAAEELTRLDFSALGIANWNPEAENQE